jgi:hypothetical protein
MFLIIERYNKNNKSLTDVVEAYVRSILIAK